MIEFENYTEPEYKINNERGVIIGKTEIMLDLFKYINELADFPSRVLLMGETGTGKELFARALHFNGMGKRKNNNFVAVNCAGIPSELLESELFGYVKGSFTGAIKDTQGKFQYANGGTILLDEIGDMSQKLQAKILRVIQEEKVTRIGSNREEKINVRIIAATNRNLEKEVKEGRFREDLYYRLNVVPIRIPELSKREEDIPLIANHFIEKYNNKYGFQVEGLSERAEEKLRIFNWKGNVRELENVIERVFVLKRDGIIESDDLYFNSDMPRRISFQKHIIISKFKEEPEKQSLEETGEWYQNGVLPISPKVISRLDGAKSYITIKDHIVNKEQVRSIKFSKGKMLNLLIYLTPESIKFFFNDMDTTDYRKLEREIRNNEFNNIVKQPFILLNTFYSINDPNTFNARISTIKAVEKSECYTVPNELRNLYFAITLSNAHHFVPKGAGKAKRISNLKERIKEAYEEFKNLKPHPLYLY